MLTGVDGRGRGNPKLKIVNPEIESYVPFPGVFVVNLVQNSSMISWGDCCLAFLGATGLTGLSVIMTRPGPGGLSYSSSGKAIDIVIVTASRKPATCTRVQLRSAMR